MFRKKPIYIIGIVLFTLVLIADLVLYFGVLGAFIRSDMDSFDPGRPGGFTSGNSDFDSLEGSNFDDGVDSGFEGFGGGGFLDKGDFGGVRPDGENSDFTMPEGMEKPMDKELPEGLDFFSKPGKDQLGGITTIFSTIRSVFWPVLIVCVIGDGSCIFMLIRISRKKKAAALQVQTAFKNPQEQDPVTGKDE